MTPSIREPRRSSWSVARVEQPRQRGDLAVRSRTGTVQRHHLVAERRLRLREHAVVVGARLVELGDHHRPRHPDVGALAPQGQGAVVDALVGRDHEERAVGGPEARADVAHEVGVPGVSIRLTLVSRCTTGATARETERSWACSRPRRSRRRWCRRAPARGMAPAEASSVSTKVVLPEPPGPTRTTLRIRSGLLASRSCPAGLRALPLSAMANTSRSTSWVRGNSC